MHGNYIETESYRAIKLQAPDFRTDRICDFGNHTLLLYLPQDFRFHGSELMRFHKIICRTHF